MGDPPEGQEHQGAAGQGGGLHCHLQPSGPEGQVVLQRRGDLQGQAVQDRGAGGWERRADHPPAHHQEADVQEHGQVHGHHQRGPDWVLPRRGRWLSLVCFGSVLFNLSQVRVIDYQ